MKILLISLIVTTMLSCSTLTIRNSATPKGVTTPDSQRTSQSLRNDFALLEMIPMSSDVALSEACPRGWQTIELRKPGEEAVLSVFFLGLFGSWRTQLLCR